MSQAKCPVDHGAASPSPGPSVAQCPVDHASLRPPPAASGEKCPVDHKTRSSWRSFLPFSSSSDAGASSHTAPAADSGAPTRPGLSVEREVSSIPRGSGTENWVYPSEAQFFAAMARKKHDPQASDMRVIVPIHNAVNERAWTEILKWEEGRGSETCGGVKLVSFMGKPGERSPRARWKTLLGYTPPFDRHDWVVDRCGVKTRYVIDFYAGRSTGPVSGMPSFFLDVRPALDSWEGVKMRVGRFWDRWSSNLLGSSSASPSRAPSSGTSAQ